MREEDHYNSGTHVCCPSGLIKLYAEGVFLVYVLIRLPRIKDS